METQHQIYRSPTPDQVREYRRSIAWRCALLFMLIVASMIWNIVFAQTTWTFCAAEDTTCTFNGTKLVRYGEPFNNRWSTARMMTSPVSCNNTTFAPDPSPGTGKRCEIMDSVNPTPLPPSSPGWADGTAKFFWSKPANNVDGSAINGTLVYRVTLSNGNMATTQALEHTFTGLAPGRYCGSVIASYESGGTPSDPTAEACKDIVAPSLPPPTPRKCWGKTRGGTGTFEQANWNLVGFAVYWQCPTPNGWVHEGFVGHWVDLDEDWEQQMAAADTDAKRDALWAARAGKNPSAYYDDVRPLYEALRLRNPLIGAEVWTVAKNSTYSNRPAYALVNGARTTTQVGKVGVGMPCDCVAHKSGSGSSTYCAVTGQANVATAAVDVLPASAAICAKVP